MLIVLYATSLISTYDILRIPKGSLYVPITPVLLLYPLSLHIKGRSFYLKDSQGLWESRGESVRGVQVWMGGNEVMGCEGVLNDGIFHIKNIK